MLSIVIPFYNKGNSIFDTLDSFRLQTVSTFEIILVDDGSDFTPDLSIYENFFENFTIVRKPNEGVSLARNYGASLAVYDWLCFVDAGDQVSNNFVELFLKKIIQYSSSEVNFIAANFSFSKGENRVTANSSVREDVYLSKDCYFEKVLDGQYVMVICSVIVSASKFREVSGFLPGATHGEDHDFMLRVIKDLEGFPYIAHPIFYYNMDDVSSVTKSPSFQPLYAHVKYLAENIEDLNELEKNYLYYLLVDFIIVNLRRGFFIKSLNVVLPIVSRLGVSGILFQIYRRVVRYVKK